MKLDGVLLERMPWSWRDPLYRLIHTASRYMHVRPGGPSGVSYSTWCGQRFTVDDVNSRTRVYEDATCLACIVAPDFDDVIQERP